MADYSPDLKLFVNGAWAAGEGREARPVMNPARGHAIGEVPLATPADLDAALEAAAKGFKLWRGTDVEARAAVLHKTAELMRERAGVIAALMTAEQGKPLAEAKAEVFAAAGIFDWYAEEAKRAYGRVLVRPAGQRSIVMARRSSAPSDSSFWLSAATARAYVSKALEWSPRLSSYRRAMRWSSST